MRKIKLTTVLVFTLAASAVHANRKADPQAPISHCYHWLQEASNGFLSYKVKYAQSKNGELSFYTNGANGAVAGPGIYCAKTPIGSYSYGDRVIRIELVDDVVLYDETRGNQHCGKDGKMFPPNTCRSKSWDIKLYNGQNEWYVIRNPQAIKSWTANDDILVKELNAIKADGDSGADAHMDATIAAIGREVKAQGKATTFYNGNGRMAFAELIRDKQKMNEIPPLSVIAMAIGDTTGKVDKHTRSNVIREQFTRALLDTDLEVSDFNEILKQESGLKAELTDAVLALESKIGGKDPINYVVLITLIDQMVDGSKLSDTMVKEIWLNAMVRPGPLASLLGTPLKKDGVIRKGFASALPSLDRLLKEVDERKTEKNLITVLQLMNDYMDSSGSNNFIDYTTEIFARLLKSPGAHRAADAYEKLTNPALRRAEAINTVLTNAANESYKGRDPFAIAELLDAADSQLPPAERKLYRTEIAALPLVVNNQPSYILLEDFKQGKTKLPSLYTRPLYFKKLVERAINERPDLQAALSPKSNGATKNATNTYRLLSQGITVYYINLYDKTKSQTEKAAILAEASGFFRELAGSLTGPLADSYAYPALQLAGVFMGYGKPSEHPLQAVFAEDHTSIDITIQKVVPSSKDGSVIEYLVSQGDDARALRMMGKIVDHLVNDLPGLLSNPEFLYVQKFEKSVWKNIVRSRRYEQSKGRVPADICYVAKVAGDNRVYFEQKFPGNAKALEQVMRSVSGHELCKRK